MPRGGPRRGAGRPPALALKQRLQVGAACERDWLRSYYGGFIRPYGLRDEICATSTSAIITLTAQSKLLGQIFSTALHQNYTEAQRWERLVSPIFDWQSHDFQRKTFGGQGWIRTSVRLRGQIYSLLPLTTRPPVPRRHIAAGPPMREAAPWRSDAALSIISRGLPAILPRTRGWRAGCWPDHSGPCSRSTYPST